MQMLRGTVLVGSLVVAGSAARAEQVSWLPPGTASLSGGATYATYTNNLHGRVSGVGGMVDGEAGVQLGDAPASITVFLRLAVLSGSSDSDPSATVEDGFVGARVAFVNGRLHGDLGGALLAHHVGYGNTNDAETDVGGAVQLRLSVELIRNSKSAIELGVDGMLGTVSVTPDTNGVMGAFTLWIGIRSFDRSY